MPDNESGDGNYDELLAMIANLAETVGKGQIAGETQQILNRMLIAALAALLRLHDRPQRVIALAAQYVDILAAGGEGPQDQEATPEQAAAVQQFLQRMAARPSPENQAPDVDET